MKSTLNSSLNTATRLCCRICGQAFFEQPLLRYQNMPATAQGFPTEDTLHQDHGADVEVCQCASCGLVQLNNAPVPYYREVIRAAGFSEEMKEFRRMQFREWVDKYALTDKKVLEIGCGRGEYLSLLQEVGVNAFGVEYAEASVDFCRKQGLSVSRGFLDEKTDMFLPQAPFDAFVCLNFMEHWPNPNATLQGISHHLSEGAIGLVEVPNFDMILDKGLFSEFISDHLLYFTQDTLSFTLQRNGFEVLDCQPVWHYYILSAVVKKRTRTNLAHFDNYRTRITTELHAFIARFPAGKVAIWGAGHQALAVIALANLGNNIRYVVDSAPFKQGKYTPATHLPIVSPATLLSNPVEAVIVMAASYSDEVAHTLRGHYSNTLKVAILRDFGLEEIT